MSAVPGRRAAPVAAWGRSVRQLRLRGVRAEDELTCDVAGVVRREERHPRVERRRTSAARPNPSRLRPYSAASRYRWCRRRTLLGRSATRGMSGRCSTLLNATSGSSGNGSTVGSGCRRRRTHFPPCYDPLSEPATRRRSGCDGRAWSARPSGRDAFGVHPQWSVSAAWRTARRSPRRRALARQVRPVTRQQSAPLRRRRPSPARAGC